jgi:hypothetical protein
VAAMVCRPLPIRATIRAMNASRDDGLGASGDKGSLESNGVGAVFGFGRAGAVDDVVRACADRVQRLEAEMRDLRSLLESMAASADARARRD